VPLLQTNPKSKVHLSKQQGRALGYIFYLPQTSNAAQGQVKGCRLHPSRGFTADSLFSLGGLLSL